ncbi:MAG: alternative ribosome rescue aminoacyl-tRNA hydrolase ArfB [Candidatus Kapaibacterium sp.]
MNASIVINEHVVIPGSELRFRTARSSGPGGQNVNKVETKVTIMWDVERAACLDEVQKQRLRFHAGRRIDDEGVLSITAQAGRSQKENKDRCVDALRQLVAKALRPPRARKKTSVPAKARRARREAKSRRSETKRQRVVRSMRLTDDE